MSEILPTSWTDLEMDWTNPNPYMQKYWSAICLAMIDHLIFTDSYGSRQLGSGYSNLKPLFQKCMNNETVIDSQMLYVIQWTIDEMFAYQWKSVNVGGFSSSKPIYMHQYLKTTYNLDWIQPRPRFTYAAAPRTNGVFVENKNLLKLCYRAINEMRYATLSSPTEDVYYDGVWKY